MKKKLLSLLLVGVMTCSVLTGCTTSNNKTELPKEGTALKGNELEIESSQGTEQPTDDIEQSTEEIVEEETTLPEGTYVREVKDGLIKEIQGDDNTSYYKVAWGNERVSGTKTDLNIEFQSVSNIGSWVDKGDDSGVWRYINEDYWATVVVWGGGLIPSNDEKLFTIDETNIEDIKKILNGIHVYEDTLSVRKDDNYVAATVKIDRTEAGLSGYATIIDDLNTNLRWIVQFIMFTDEADYDMLKASAESLVIGLDFNKESLEKEVKVSDEPLIIFPQIENDQVGETSTTN